MIGVCSVYPFGVVIWQDVSNMSCKRWHDATMRCKDTKKTSIMATVFLCHVSVILDKIYLKYARNNDFMPCSQ